MTDTETRAILKAALAREGRPSSDFDLDHANRPPEPATLRDAGVLVAITEAYGRAEVILTKRSSRLTHHPGQIAFAGGKVDPGDGTPVAAALREAHEEIGLDPASVDVLGTMPPHETVTGFRVTPVLAWVRQAFDPMPEAGEVDEIFRVPLAHVTDPARFTVQSRPWQGRSRPYYVVPWGPYYIWGATARMLRALADRMSP